MNDTSASALPARHTIVKKYHRHILWVILAFLFALDIFTTSICLQLGGIEKNPVMIPVVNNPLFHGLVKISAYLLLFVVIEGSVIFIQEKQPEKKPFWIKLNYQTLYGLIIFTLISLIWLYFYVIIANIIIIS